MVLWRRDGEIEETPKERENDIMRKKTEAHRKELATEL